MHGITGLRLLHLGARQHVADNSSLVPVIFPAKTTVTSQQMVDSFGRPTYRKDIKA